MIAAVGYENDHPGSVASGPRPTRRFPFLKNSYNRRIDDYLDRNYFGSGSLEIFGLAIRDPNVMELMKRILAGNFAKQFGELGAGFVRSCFQEFSELPCDARPDEVQEVFRRARRNFHDSGLHYRGSKFDYGRLQLRMVADYLSGTVIDVGADDNNLGESLLGLNPGVREVVGTDIEMREGTRTSVELQFRLQTDPFRLPVDDCSADSVIIKHALHHMTFAEQERVLLGCHRCLALGGHLVIYEDTYSFDRSPLNDSHSYHKDIVALGTSSRIRLLLAAFDIWPQVYKDKHMPFPSSYRSVEDWEALFRRFRFEPVDSIFYGIHAGGYAAAPLGVFILRRA